jgi:hypothetical protein
MIMTLIYFRKKLKQSLNTPTEALGERAPGEGSPVPIGPYFSTPMKSNFVLVRIF